MRGPSDPAWLGGWPRSLARVARDEMVRRQAQWAQRRDLGAAVRAAGGAQRARLGERMAVLLGALGHEAPAGAGPDELAGEVVRALDGAGPGEVWLALAVLTAELPLAEEVLAASRRLRLDGPAAALGPPVAARTAPWAADRRHPAEVEVLTGAVAVDMHHTSRTELATGIQRVAREAVRRWVRDHDVVLLGWNDEGTALVRLDATAAARAVGDLEPGRSPALGDRSPVADSAGSDGASSERGRSDSAGADDGAEAPGPARRVVVPWRSTYTMIELATEEPRTRRLHALARWSDNRTGIVGHDCVPLTMAETAAESMGADFASYLVAVRHVDRVATVSEAAAREYGGWRAMLTGCDWPGPSITAVPLPRDGTDPGPAAVEAARSRLCTGALPLVLVVGSHEPRKNHLAVLHAAELLWRRGVRFSLLFVGGNAWHSERFVRRLDELRGTGRPVESLSAITDELLWSAYRLARVVLFPSLHEGYGLPVAEALAAGTPVVTSAHGSMDEIARHGGALLVDPREDHAIADALERVVTDDGLHASLAAAAGAMPRRTWDDYAAELWSTLVAP